MKRFLNTFSVLIIWLTLCLVIICLSGCKTCPPASIVVRDSMRTEVKIVPHDTLIYISSEPIHVYHTLQCDSLGIIRAFKKTFRSNGIKAVVEVKNNELTVDCEADSLKKVITTINIEKNAIIEHSRNEVKIETKIVNAFWVKPMMWLLLVLFVVVLWQNRKRIASLFV